MCVPVIAVLVTKMKLICRVKTSVKDLLTVAIGVIVFVIAEVTANLALRSVSFVASTRNAL